MTKTQATIEAQREANENGITMVVTFDRYAEHAGDRWGWMPAGAESIFNHEEVRATITPEEK